MKPIIIVNPLSSGIDLAPAFKKREVPLIAVLFQKPDRVGFGTQVKSDDFMVQYSAYEENLVSLLRKHDPIASCSLP